MMQRTLGLNLRFAEHTLVNRRGGFVEAEARTSYTAALLAWSRQSAWLDTPTGALWPLLTVASEGRSDVFPRESLWISWKSISSMCNQLRLRRRLGLHFSGALDRESTRACRNKPAEHSTGLHWQIQTTHHWFFNRPHCEGFCTTLLW